MNNHKPLTAGEIEEIKSLEAKATPGPWAWEFTGDDNTCAVGTVMDENDNFVAGMVDGDADTIVVDSVCREVTNQQDAAFIAAARNALPRLLSMLIPPPDAAVREAVERCEAHIRAHTGHVYSLGEAIRTILRAVPAPRLTEEQVEAVQSAKAEARVRELEVENAAAKQEVTDMDSACNTLLSSVCAERDALEAFKSRVMVWARGRCYTCRWDCAHPQPGKPGCNACSNGDKGDWTPAWGVEE